MNPQSMVHAGIPFWLVEFGFLLLSLCFATAWPKCGERVIVRVERALFKLARRHHLAVLSVFVTAIGLRLAILPFCPIPLPFIPDDFSFRLAGETFALGRLTNPAPASWVHFETIHVTMLPTYMSMYFPAQGLVLAAGRIVFGEPWFGLLIVNALMCAAICWTLQGWLPSGWALLGGVIAVLRLSLFSYWINTCTGGGAVAALGGALVLGAFPRILRKTRHVDCVLLAVGISVLILSRPYEGMLLCLPVLGVLMRWLWKGKDRPSAKVLIPRAVLPLALVAGTMLWLGHYDTRAFGKATTLPYTVDRETYAVAPYWIWQDSRPEPVYRHKELREFYVGEEQKVVTHYRTLLGFLIQNLWKPLMGIYFFAGLTLLPPLIMLSRTLRDRRLRFIRMSLLVWLPGMFIVIFLLPHYLAPFTSVAYLIGLQSMRHLRFWRPRGLPVGQSLVRLTIVSCLVLAGMRVFAAPLHLSLADWPASAWTSTWYGSGRLGEPRAEVLHELAGMGGKHLVLVRYSAKHDSANEWVYNSPDIEHSNVIWARDMGSSNNLGLIHHYPDRKVWLIEPDSASIPIAPYPAIEGAHAQLREVSLRAH